MIYYCRTEGSLVGLGLQYSKIFYLKFKSLTFQNN